MEPVRHRVVGRMILVWNDQGDVYWHQYDDIELDLQTEWDESAFDYGITHSWMVRKFVQIKGADPEPSGLLLAVYDGLVQVQFNYPVPIEEKMIMEFSSSKM